MRTRSCNQRRAASDRLSIETYNHHSTRRRSRFRKKSKWNELAPKILYDEGGKWGAVKALQRATPNLTKVVPPNESTTDTSTRDLLATVEESARPGGNVSAESIAQSSWMSSRINFHAAQSFRRGRTSQRDDDLGGVLEELDVRVARESRVSRETKRVLVGGSAPSGLWAAAGGKVASVTFLQRGGDESKNNYLEESATDSDALVASHVRPGPPRGDTPRACAQLGELDLPPAPAPAAAPSPATEMPVRDIT